MSETTRILINCYYDGMTITEAQAFITRCYGETPTARQIKDACTLIKEYNGVIWN